MKKILLSLMCIVAVYTTSQAQVCDGPLTVEIEGSSSSDPLNVVEDGVTQPDCAGPTGSINITISGGNPDYTITWSQDGSFFSNDEDLINIGAGEYEVEVVDANGCNMTLGPWTLTEPSDIAIAGDVTQPDCNIEGEPGTGQIDLTVSGGTGAYTYDWSTTDGDGLVAGQADQSALTGGTYTVVVTDENGCEKEESFTIDAPDQFTASLEAVDPDCNGENGTENGSITTTVAGGTGAYTYAWSTTDGSGLVAGAANQTDLTGGTYTVVITDENNCSITLEATLEGAEPMEITEVTSAPSCHVDNGTGDGSITITTSGGSGTYTYTWTTTDGAGIVDGQQNQSTLTAGTYTVEVSDDNGCSTWKEITLEGPDAIDVVAESSSPGCFGDEDGTITVTSITGGAGTAISDYTLDWSTEDGDGLVAGAASQTGLSAGTYTLVVTDANDCTASYEYEITEPSEIVLTVDEVSQLSCHHDSGPADGAISISVAGGSGVYTYEWSTLDGSGIVDGDEDQSGLSAGTYTLQVYDNSGCFVEEEFILVEPAVVAIGHTVIPPNCSGENGSIWTAVSGGQGSAPTDYTYTWSTTDGSGLTDGTVHQQNVGPGTYNLTVEDSNGCSNTAEFVIESPSDIEVTADVTTEILCNGETGEIQVTATGGTGPYTYSLDGGDFGVSSVFGTLSAGTYTVTVKDANDCEEELDVTITEPDALTAGTCTEVQDLCQVSEGEIQVQAFGGVAPYTVDWVSTNGGLLNEATGQEIATDGGSFTFTGAEGGKSYSFTITDANGCVLE